MNAELVALNTARAELKAVETKLIEARTQADAARQDADALAAKVAALATERGSVLRGGDGRALAAVSADLRSARIELEDARDLADTLAHIVAERESAVFVAEKAVQEALDGAWGSRFAEGRTALVEALARLVPAYWQSGRKWRGSLADATLGGLLSDLASDERMLGIAVDLTTAEPPAGFERAQSQILDPDRRSALQNAH